MAQEGDGLRRCRLRGETCGADMPLKGVRSRVSPQMILNKVGKGEDSPNGTGKMTKNRRGNDEEQAGG